MAPDTKKNTSVPTEEVTNSAVCPPVKSLALLDGYTRIGVEPEEINLLSLT